MIPTFKKTFISIEDFVELSTENKLQNHLRDHNEKLVEEISLKFVERRRC